MPNESPADAAEGEPLESSAPEQMQLKVLISWSYFSRRIHMHYLPPKDLFQWLKGDVDKTIREMRCSANRKCAASFKHINVTFVLHRRVNEF